MNDNLMPKLYPVGGVQYLLIDGNDLISQKLISGNIWEEFLIESIINFLDKMSNPVFIDIGANLGAVTIPIGNYLQDKGGSVYAFEAQRNVYYQLCANIFANNLSDHCFAYHVAVGDTVKDIKIPYTDVITDSNVGSFSLDNKFQQEMDNFENFCKLLSMSEEDRKGYHPKQKQRQKKYETVQMKTLDKLKLPFASLIKIDVEGLELEVLKGAKDWIKASNYPPIILEILSEEFKFFKEKRKLLIDFLSNTLGYELFIIDTSIIGQCIAQHKTNKFFDFYFEDNQLTMKEI